MIINGAIFLTFMTVSYYCYFNNLCQLFWNDQISWPQFLVPNRTSLHKKCIYRSIRVCFIWEKIFVNDLSQIKYCMVLNNNKIQNWILFFIHNFISKSELFLCSKFYNKRKSYKRKIHQIYIVEIDSKLMYVWKAMLRLKVIKS